MRALPQVRAVIPRGASAGAGSSTGPARYRHLSRMHVLALFLASQFAAVQDPRAGAGDSIYASASVRALVSEAARLNRRVPETLAGYRASAESEMAIIARRSEGHEGVVSIEQTRNEVRWARPGAYEQHVVGYRAESMGLQFSSLSYFRQAWTVPVLYGNRLTLLFGRDTTRQGRGGSRRPQRLVAVHPLADDRDRFYRFSGGDTLVRLRVDGREIPIVRIVAEPRGEVPEGVIAFQGELDLDASRHVLVRMRGQFVRHRPPPSLAGRLAALGRVEVVAYLELENGEVAGRYWLPTYQRFEAQLGVTAATASRSVFRIITRFRDHRVVESSLAEAADTLVAQPFALTYATPDSLARDAGWRTAIGDATGSVHSDDFNDIGPDAWRPTGRPLLVWRVQRVMDAVHFNRVEGLYTGYGAEWRLRDAVPGLVVRGNAGWAWRESTLRGRVGGDWVRGANTYIVRAGRTLDITNDFRQVFDSGSIVGPLFTSDNYDYVDRRLAALGYWRQLGKGRTAILRLETGPASDRMVRRRVSHGLFTGDSAFRENRGVREGNYWRSWGSLEWHPDVSAEFVRSGVGGRVSAEVARGSLRYARLEGRLTARKSAGRWTVAARSDVGTVLGSSPPPQQLFELGRSQHLPGYRYKEFAGTEAAQARALLMYRLGVMQSPIRVRRWYFPPIAPALAAGVQSGWTQVRGAGGWAAMRELGWSGEGPAPSSAGDTGGSPTTRSPSRTTGGVRTSVTLGMRFFGGAVGAGFARAVDRGSKWGLLFDFSQGF